MIKVNKKLPVNVLKSLNEFVLDSNNLNTALFSIESTEYLFKAVDTDKSSGFYYLIKDYNEKHGYLINYTPTSQSNNGIKGLWVSAEKLSTHFGIWYDCLKAYFDLEEEIKDPFLKNMEEQFLEEFQLTDALKKEPLSLKQLFFLEESLEKIENEIKNYSTKENEAEILEIIEDARSLRNVIGKKNQEWVAKKFASILAKITKEGPGILKGIFKEAGKQIMTQGVKFLLENGSALIS